MTKLTPKALYKGIMAMATASLEPDEYWVVCHEEGPLWDTASKRMDDPVVTFCTAMKCDWDEAKESGFWLGKLKKETA